MGPKLLGNSIGNGFGALQGCKTSPKNQFGENHKKTATTAVVPDEKFHGPSWVHNKNYDKE